MNPAIWQEYKKLRKKWGEFGQLGKEDKPTTTLTTQIYVIVTSHHKSNQTSNNMLIELKEDYSTHSSRIHLSYAKIAFKRSENISLGSTFHQAVTMAKEYDRVIVTSQKYSLNPILSIYNCHPCGQDKMKCGLQRVTGRESMGSGQAAAIFNQASIDWWSHTKPHCYTRVAEVASYDSLSKQLHYSNLTKQENLIVSFN